MRRSVSAAHPPPQPVRVCVCEVSDDE
jgi:hypothetical protein